MHHHHDHNHDHDHDHPHSHDETKKYYPAIVSAVLLVLGLAFDYGLKLYFFSGAFRFVFYSVAYLPVAWPVIRQGIKLAGQGNLFTEFFLMSLATVGAFAIGEYPEGVAVMLFYAVGELFQDAAVGRSKKNIQSLLDKRPSVASVLRQGKLELVKPETVSIGETIQTKAGERVALDGILLSESAAFNTSALTGESRPKIIRKGELVLAGMISIDQVIEIKVEKKFVDSSFSRILQLVQSAIARKAPTELFIRKFAQVYTPSVVLLACLVVGLPYFFDANYSFSEWLYRALIFLVVSCPCALVISIPLGYFGGIGAASANGILFKGSNYLDLLARVDAVVFDKTGTLTEGVFKVQDISPSGIDQNELIHLLSALESKSSHPIAKAILEYGGESQNSADSVKEFPGEGLSGKVNGKDILAGNEKLMNRFGVTMPASISEVVDTLVIVAIDNKYCGHLTIADQVKSGSADVVFQLSQLGIRETVLLSGDKDSIARKVASELGIKSAFGGLLPDQKIEQFSKIKSQRKIVAFVGDGINDAPVLALSDVGIAMGTLGSDAAIETANVVIQTDQPEKIGTAIRIARATKSIVWQNISLAFGVKLVVLSLGTFGVATMWEAVFADVGVALLAILNAVRLQQMKF
ncbi:cadmium/zinc/cobalt-transporting ATPase [Cytophagales bacterium WSM2-2]|nr:cadmium/zinc/cobalt-transporting ATPase [Cytophagales bacterium WSM2-2]